MELGIKISGVRNVTLRFDEFPERAREGLRQAISRAGEQLKAAAQQRAPKRTGRLESEIKLRVVERDNRISAIVGIQGETHNDYAKAGAEEYGAHGETQVQAHSARLSHLFSRPMTTMTVLVDAHSRRLNITDRYYLRGALDEIRASAMDAMRAAVEEAAEE